MPPLLVGRNAVLEQFAEAINDGSGAPGLLTLIAGPQGMGKTVALTAMGGVATSAGWLHLSETAAPGFLIRIRNQMICLIEELDFGASSVRGSSLFSAGVRGTTASQSVGAPQWRDTAILLLGLLDAEDTGLLITVDDINSDEFAELAQLAADVQHLIRYRLPVALVLAGSPDAVAALLNEEVVAFLRRAERVNLGPVSIDEAVTALGTALTQSGVTLTDNQLSQAAAATNGNPSLIQLVGDQIWQRAQGGTITGSQFEQGLKAAPHDQPRPN